MATRQHKIGTEINKLFSIQQKLDVFNEEIKKIEKKKERVEKQYKEQEAKIFERFNNQDIDGAVGKDVKAVINRKTVYNIASPEKFYAFIKKTDNFQLLQRRVNTKNVIDLMEAEKKKAIPGLVPFVVIKLKLTKK